MITLNLEYREVLWWMQGGMSGSHLRWSVYEDMVNMVWPQCSEQERRNLWLFMRRDLGYWWRPDGWQGIGFDKPGEGEWREDITDETPWMYFRQVLARFDPENQYAVTLKAKTDKEVESSMIRLDTRSVISRPQLVLSKDKKRMTWDKTVPLIVRTYKWQDPEGKDAYFIDWKHRCAPERITKVEKLEIPDDGTM